MLQQSLEETRCAAYVDATQDEMALSEWVRKRDLPITLVVAEGFEERSVGVLQKLALAGVKVQEVVIGRYERDLELNARNRDRFEELAERVAPGRWRVVQNNNDGDWVRNASKSASDSMVLDVSGVSNRALFPVLDALSASALPVHIAYSEAGEYWPKRRDWETLSTRLKDPDQLAEHIDEQPWLFGYEHTVEIIPGHEGYDTAGAGSALLAFLPFKAARLAAIVGGEDYRHLHFVAGRPYRPENQWRIEALRRINEAITRSWPVTEIGTFGYRNCIHELSKILFASESLLNRFDVHLALLGSKLQLVGCWAFSSMVRSITAVTSVPSRYYPAAFSDGVGESWVFRLIGPASIHNTP